MEYTETDFITMGVPHADFGVIVNDNSMTNAHIFPGDMVYISKGDKFANGQIVAVIIDNDIYIRRIREYPERGYIMLSADSLEPYPPIIQPPDAVTVIGKAVFRMGHVL